MEVVPVIDLKGGEAVRARGGRRDEYRPIETPLSPSSRPADVVAGLLRLFPFRRVYVADLDAIERVGDHAAVLAGLVETWPWLDFWVDNGIRHADQAAAWLAGCSGSLVIGSESQSSPDLVQSLRMNPRVVLSLDFRGDVFQGPPTILADADLWPSRVIAMTLAKVGSGAGPDLARIKEIVGRGGLRQVYAAGGIRDGGDLRLAASAGAAGALVATALHGGALTAAELGEIAQFRFKTAE
jgi:phosphoribosylformimino-5-aminoimidazole carboxamide ribotide isomerase